jgi:hypothetical protein
MLKTIAISICIKTNYCTVSVYTFTIYNYHKAAASSDAQFANCAIVGLEKSSLFAFNSFNNHIIYQHNVLHKC